MKNEQKTGQENLTEQEIISKHMRNLQKKSAEARKRNDPDTYKKMANLRHERKEDLTIKVE